MGEYSYVTVKQQIGNGCLARTCYGVAAVVNYDGCIHLMQCYNDVSDDIDSLSQFVDLCNELHVELAHFEDVIEDFMSTGYDS